MMLTFNDKDVQTTFVAMEYYWFIFNRSFKIFVSAKGIYAIKIRGPMMSLRAYSTNPDWQTPETFVPISIINKYKNILVTSKEILNLNKDNFILPLSDLESVAFDDSNKWGMGYVPHSGKLYIKEHGCKKREFILLGKQDGFRLQKELTS